jgi:hypothetical protein
MSTSHQRTLRKEGGRKTPNRPPQSPSTLVARGVAEMALNGWTPAQRRSVFGAVGRAETLAKPAHRLSPRQGRRLRRRSVALLAEQQRQRRIEAARARAATSLSAPERCAARTKLNTQCRRPAVADGYCRQHGG